MSPSSGRGQVVNNADQRDPWPIEPIDLPAPLRHGEYHCSNLCGQFTCDCMSRVQWSEQVPLGPTQLWQHWSALVRAKCELPFPMHGQYEHSGSIRRKSCGLHGDSGSIHFCCACSHSCACICHKLLLWHKHNMCCWICPTCRSGLSFPFYSRNGRPAGNYMQMKTVSIKHDPRVWSWNNIPNLWLSPQLFLHSYSDLSIWRLFARLLS